MDNNYKEYLERLPFLTYGTAHNNEYIGIMIVRSKNFTSMYMLNHIDKPELKRELLELGEKWWWQSNRNIPISIFLAEQLRKFEKYKQTFISKEFTVIDGPVVSITNLPTKRIKRCTTILKNKPKL